MEWNWIALSVGDALGRPATVKCRIGVDDADSYEGTYVYVHTSARTWNQWQPLFSSSFFYCVSNCHAISSHII